MQKFPPATSTGGNKRPKLHHEIPNVQVQEEKLISENNPLHIDVLHQLTEAIVVDASRRLCAPPPALIRVGSPKVGTMILPRPERHLPPVLEQRDHLARRISHQSFDKFLVVLPKNVVYLLSL